MALDTDLSSKRRRVEDLIAMNQSELLVAEETAQRGRERQYELKSLLNNTTAVTSLLPCEVLAEIFLAVSFREGLSPFFNPIHLPPEYIIARVCKQWREIAWTTPRLWCRISIDLSRDRYEAQKCLLEEWIQRSGACPLEMEIIVNTYSQWEPPPDAFDNIIQSCTRWKIFISNAFTSLSIALEKGTALRFPLLETLKLWHNNALEAPLEKWKFNFPPKLKNLNIINSLLGRGLAVNWSALTSLRANILLGPRLEEPKECIPLEVLMSCRSLVDLDCELITSIVDPNHVFYPTTVCFPSLQGFSVTAMTCTTAQFMAMTEFPALTALAISVYNPAGPPHPEDPAWTTALVDWAKRSSFKLESLKVWTDKLVEDHHITHMIRQLSPSQPIKMLCIHTPDNPRLRLSNSLIEQLTMKHSGGIEEQQEHLPHLGLFGFRGDISFTVSMMISMLKSRKRYAELLKESAMEESSSDDDDEEEEEEGGEDGDNDGDGGEDGNGDENEPTAEEVANPTANANEDPSDSISPETLTIQIEYGNRSWLQMQNPNRMRHFYRTVEEFDMDGRTFYLEYEDYGESDED